MKSSRKRRIRSTGIIIWIGFALLGATSVSAETLITTDGLELRTFDTTSEQFSALSGGGELIIDALATDANGAVYSATFEGLLRIDPANGQQTQVGAWNPPIQTPQVMSFDASGRLFISSFARLYSVDPATAETTLLAEPTPQVLGLGTDGDRLLALGLVDESWALYEVNPETGALNELFGVALPPPGGIIAASTSRMCIDSRRQGFWVFTSTSSILGTRYEYRRLELASGEVLELGTFPEDTTFFPSACAPLLNGTINVPGLTGPGLAILALLIAGAGFAALRRRGL